MKDGWWKTREFLIDNDEDNDGDKDDVIIEQELDDQNLASCSDPTAASFACA